MNQVKIDDIFTHIYETNAWGSNESRSGIGSTIEFTESIRKELVHIIHKFDIKSMIDTSCGDWNWMKLIQKELPDYVGIDIVKRVIEVNQQKYSNDKTRFVNDNFLDYISKLDDKSVDLILCRHTLEHLPEDYNVKFLEECSRVSKYLLVTTHELTEQNTPLNYPNTYRPVNIRLKPYSFIMPYLKCRIYDGPSKFLPEMFIMFFDFTQIFGLDI
jgi:ubiquinone/menaquinone biosynthesis C-methylase UbiE